MTTQERVERGAKLLDEFYKSEGWAHKIDTDALEMEDECACILGQLLGHYFSFEVDRLVEPMECGRRFTTISYGFSRDTEGWEELTEAWLVAIKQRRNEEVKEL